MNQNEIIRNVPFHVTKAVAHYWQTRAAQRKKQEEGAKADQGLRIAVTGGAQMDGFIDLFTNLIIKSGISENCIFRKRDH